MPHALHASKGVWMVAVLGSKALGTGFGRLHIVQIHVAVETVDTSMGTLNGLSDVCGDSVLSREGDSIAFAWAEARLRDSFG